MDNELLEKGLSYSVGTNDGKVFERIVYKGTKNIMGKNIMCFETQNRESVSINPSYFSYSIEDKSYFPMPEDFNNKQGDS